MRYIGFLIFLMLIPVFHAMIASGSRRYVAFLLGALPFLADVAHLTVAPITWRYWPGYVKGVEFSVIDALAIAVLLTPRAGRARAIHVVPFALMMAFAAVSAFYAKAPPAAIFVAWQTFRVFLIYVAAARLASDMAGMRALVGGLVFGLGCNAVWALVQHFQGVYQAPGLMEHQNMLGMMAHFVVLPAAALYVADRRARWALLGLAAGGAVAILGASRATIGLEAIALVVLIVAVALFWPSKRGFVILAGGAFALLIMAPLAYSALGPRLAAAEKSDYDERAAFEHAAKAMMSDHPAGVGANHYVLVANVDGYSDRARVGWSKLSRAMNVHNAYLLTGAEMGYAALLPFIWLTVLTAFGGLFWCFRSKDKALSVALFGLCMAELVVAVHNLFEWVFVTYIVQVVFCTNLGMIAALITQIRASRGRGAELDQTPAPAGPAVAATA